MHCQRQGAQAVRVWRQGRRRLHQQRQLCARSQAAAQQSVRRRCPEGLYRTGYTRDWLRAPGGLCRPVVQGTLLQYRFLQGVDIRKQTRCEAGHRAQAQAAQCGGAGNRSLEIRWTIGAQLPQRCRGGCDERAVVRCRTQHAQNHQEATAFLRPLWVHETPTEDAVTASHHVCANYRVQNSITIIRRPMVKIENGVSQGRLLSGPYEQLHSMNFFGSAINQKCSAITRVSISN